VAGNDHRPQTKPAGAGFVFCDTMSSLFDDR
jgi:hypothetical protein